MVVARSSHVGKRWHRSVVVAPSSVSGATSAITPPKMVSAVNVTCALAKTFAVRWARVSAAPAKRTPRELGAGWRLCWARRRTRKEAELAERKQGTRDCDADGQPRVERDHVAIDRHVIR